MSGVPEAFICHNAKGRNRFRIPSKKRDIEYFASLKARMEKCGGVEKIETNPLTGGVLVIHGVDTRSVCGFAEDNGLFKVEEIKTAPADVHREVSEIFKGLDKKIKNITGNGMNIGSMSFLALAGIGIYQISRGNFSAPAWYTAFWYALNIFLKSKSGKENDSLTGL